MKLMQTSVLSRLKPALFVYNFDLLVDHSIGELVKIFKQNPFDPRLRPHKIHKLSAIYGVNCVKYSMHSPTPAARRGSTVNYLSHGSWMKVDRPPTFSSLKLLNYSLELRAEHIHLSRYQVAARAEVSSPWSVVCCQLASRAIR
jgi:hypothetical protein